MPHKLSERRVALTMPAADLAALDAYCVSLRKATGERIERAELIRRAISTMLAQANVLLHEDA